jgi:hypothetical protein
MHVLHSGLFYKLVSYNAEIFKNTKKKYNLRRDRRTYILLRCFSKKPLVKLLVDAGEKAMHQGNLAYISLRTFEFPCISTNYQVYFCEMLR